jgi:2,4-dienoyl-CoA reductase-like NADH-dependent reductase (Old Yellow Enzyme family)
MPSILEPLTFRTGLQSRNRVVLAPMTNKQSHADGTLSDDELGWLCSRAEGGYGVVMTCAAHVTRDGQGWPGELGVFDDAHVPGLRRLAQALRERGAASIVQIFHGGMRADERVTGQTPWSASESEGVRAATPDDLQRTIAAFAAAARRCHEAGFDGVEIHGAHGYLLTQFASAVDNRRTDAWGGTLDNRARLVREVTRAVRASVPSTFTVGVRLSLEDFGNARGLDLDESLQVARWLADDGVDFVHASLWRALLNSRKRPEEHVVPQLRAVLPRDVSILVAGTVWTRDEAESLLERGADAVALGRAAICNRDWPLRIADPSYVPRRPPVTIEALRAEGLGAAFAEYMRAWKDFVV